MQIVSRETISKKSQILFSGKKYEKYFKILPAEIFSQLAQYY